MLQALLGRWGQQQPQQSPKPKPGNDNRNQHPSMQTPIVHGLPSTSHHMVTTTVGQQQQPMIVSCQKKRAAASPADELVPQKKKQSTVRPPAVATQRPVLPPVLALYQWSPPANSSSSTSTTATKAWWPCMVFDDVDHMHRFHTHVVTHQPALIKDPEQQQLRLFRDGMFAFLSNTTNEVQVRIVPLITNNNSPSLDWPVILRQADSLSEAELIPKQHPSFLPLQMDLQMQQSEGDNSAAAPPSSWQAHHDILFLVLQLEREQATVKKLARRKQNISVVGRTSAAASSPKMPAAPARSPAVMPASPLAAAAAATRHQDSSPPGLDDSKPAAVERTTPTAVAPPDGDDTPMPDGDDEEEEKEASKSTRTFHDDDMPMPDADKEEEQATEQSTKTTPSSKEATAVAAVSTATTIQESNKALFPPEPSNLKKRCYEYKEGEKFDLHTFDKDIKKLLIKGKHTFFSQRGGKGCPKKQIYCRPNGDPRVYPETAVLGKHYFDKEIDYRRYLCQHGIEYIGVNPWTYNDDNIYDNDEEESPMSERDKLERWVRFSNLTTEVTTSLPSLHFKGDKYEALKLLMESCHLQWKAPNIGPSGYVIPGDPTKTVYVDGKEATNDNNLWIRLAKMGLTKECKMGGKKNAPPLDAWNLFALEFFLLSTLRAVPAEQAFIERKHNPSNSPGRTWTDDDDSSETECSSTAAATGSPESVDKDALSAAHCEAAVSGSQRGKRALTRKRSNTATLPRKRLQMSPTVPNGDRSIAQHQDKEHEATDAEQGLPAEPGQLLEEHDGKNETKSKITPGESSKCEQHRVCDDVVQVKETSLEQVVLSGDSVREKLASCMEAMKKAAGEELTIVGDLCSSLGETRTFLRAVFRSKGRHGHNKEPPVLHICGVPGSGKTMGVKWCHEKELEEFISHKQKHEGRPRYAFLNATQLQKCNMKDAIKKVLQELGVSSVSQMKRSKNELSGKNAAAILVLDEIDYLVTSGKQKKQQGILQQLLKWANDETMLLSVIGISNSVENQKVDNMRSLGLSKASVIFKTYSIQELETILQSKIGTEVFHEQAIKLLATKVSTSSGDARKYLELAGRSMEIAASDLTDDVLDKPLVKPVVMIKHAHKATMQDKLNYKDVIQALPQFQKQALVTINHVAKICTRPVKISGMRVACLEAGGLGREHSSFAGNEFILMLEQLVNSGLVSISHGQKRKTGKSQWQMGSKITFDQQLDDVDSAIEQVLMTIPMYTRMRTNLEKPGAMNGM